MLQVCGLGLDPAPHLRTPETTTSANTGRSPSTKTPAPCIRRVLLDDWKTKALRGIVDGTESCPRFRLTARNREQYVTFPATIARHRPGSLRSSPRVSAMALSAIASALRRR